MISGSTIPGTTPAGDPEAPAAGHAPARRKILLVEDEMIIAFAESEVLKARGYEVVIAGSGKKAVEIIKTGPSVDLVLMDIDLGKGMDGTDAAREILALKNLPIVFLTSHSEQEMVEKVRGITRYGYMIKNSGDFVLLSSIEMAFELFDAHQQTRDSEERYRLLLQKANDAVYVHEVSPSATGRFLEANDQACRMLEYTREEFLRMNVSDIDVPEQASRLPEILIRLFECGHAVFCTDHLARDGRRVPVEISTSLFDLQGRPTVLSVVRDITERRKAEEAIQLLQRRNELILASAGEGIYGLDREGVTTFVNPAAARMLGYEESELLGRNLHLTFHHSKPDGTPHEIEECPIYASFSDGAVHSSVGSEVFWRKDGSSFPVEYTSTPLRDIHGGIIGAVVVFRDMTGRTGDLFPGNHHR